MADKPLAKYPKINDPAGAYKVFKEIDLERLDSMGLTADITYYLGRFSGFDGLSAVYEGKLSDRNGVLCFPKPKYIMSLYDVQGSSRAYLEDSVPNQVLTGQLPKNLEFHLTTSPGNYSCLRMFRDDFIPRLFKEGYTAHNLDHQSIFWLYLKREGFLLKSFLHISSEGLFVSQDRSDSGNTLVFSPMDLERFANIS